MLKYDVPVGEYLQIGEAVIRVDAKTGARTRLAIEVPPGVKIRKLGRNLPGVPATPPATQS